MSHICHMHIANSWQKLASSIVHEMNNNWAMLISSLMAITQAIYVMCYAKYNNKVNEVNMPHCTLGDYIY